MSFDSFHLPLDLSRVLWVISWIVPGLRKERRSTKPHEWARSTNDRMENDKWKMNRLLSD